jgi:hypothetical protein
MSTTNVVYVEKLGGTSAADYIGRDNELFYNAEDGFLRISNGETPGGTLLNMVGRQGYCAAFYDTTIQTNQQQINTIKFNSTYISDGIDLVDQDKITFLHNGRYNIQFSFQLEKTDSGTDEIEIFLLRNGEIGPWSNTKFTLSGNNAKTVAAWNYVVEESAGTYIQLAWYSLDQNVRIYAESAATNPVRPGIPSAIATVTQV